MLTSIRAKLGQLKIALASTSPRRIDMFKIMVRLEDLASFHYMIVWSCHNDLIYRHSNPCFM